MALRYITCGSQSSAQSTPLAGKYWLRQDQGPTQFTASKAFFQISPLSECPVTGRTLLLIVQHSSHLPSQFYHRDHPPPFPWGLTFHMTKSTSSVKAGHMTGTDQSIYPIFLSMVMSLRADLRVKSICYDLTWCFHVKVSFQTPLVVCTSLLSYLMDGTSSYIILSRLKRWVSSFACLFQDQRNISQAATSRNPYILCPRMGSYVYLIKLLARKCCIIN